MTAIPQSSAAPAAVDSLNGSRATAAGWLFPLLLVLFLLSGVSALIYQVLWLRLLGVVFGVTIYAASTVLASFMSGLAVGSYVAGRVADRAPRPLLLFGLAELLVGATAVATPWALDAVKAVYVRIHPALPESLALLTAVRFMASFAVLIVPTALMGATLPLVVKSSLLSIGNFGARVSLLYGTNTAGAIVGAIVAGFYLIPVIGMQRSFMLAAALNALVGVLAIAAAFALPPVETGNTAGAAAPDQAPSDDADLLPHGMQTLVLVVFFISGFASLALEVIWVRVLVMVLRATTYAFTIMLAAILAGIAAGSYVVTPLMRRRLDWLAVLALLELGIGITALLSFFALGWYFELQPVLRPYLDAIMVDYVSPLVLASFLAIFPTALLLGMAFPIGIRLYAGGGAHTPDTAARIGRLYSSNVFGAILGSLVAGFVLLPQLGSEMALLLIATLAFGSGLLIIANLDSRRRTFAWTAGTVGLLLFAVLAAKLPSPFQITFDRLFRNEQVLWREEGAQTTVSIHARRMNSRNHRIMYLDGSHQANDTPGTVFVHRRIGFLPTALHPNPKEALVVGLGGGATAGAVSAFRGVNIDVVELSDTVVRGSRYFQHINFNLLQRPGVQLRVDDGRNHMLLTSKRYDVVTADIILPRHAGAGNLYSADYFRLVYNVLKDDGMAVQWVSPESEEEYNLITRTFLSVFPHSTLWADGSLLIGTKRPLTLRRADFERKLADPAQRETLETMGIGTFERLASLYLAGPDELHRYVGTGPILTDDRPMVEYFLTLKNPQTPVDLSQVKGDISHILRD